MHKRLHYLDNLKTFALLLGILFHSSIVYAPNIGYAIKNKELNYLFSILVHLIHVFRMPLFFFLSGFFSFMVLDKKGGKKFTFSKIERMFAPTIVGILLFAPIQYHLVYNQLNKPISFWTYYPKFFSAKEFDYSHIWFLIYLFIYSFFLIVNYKLKITKKLFSISFFGLKQRFISLNRFAVNSISTYFYFFIKSILFCFTMFLFANIFFNKDYTILKIQPVAFLYYLAFFIIGVIAYKNNILQQFSIIQLSNNKPSRTIFIFTGIFLLFSAFLFINEIDPYWMDFMYEIKKILFRTSHLFLESILAWSMIFILLHYFHLYLDHSGPLLDYLRNSGMSIYLIHHPISLILGNFFLTVNISFILKFIFHTFLVYALSYIFYHFIIKKSFILKNLFGTK